MEKKDFKKNETKKLIIGGVICFAILIGALGYTYSYFSASATNNSVITGRVESTVLTLNVSEVVPNNGAKLVPQRDSAITKAVTGVNGKCIDGNNNTICKVYSVTIKNISTTAPVNVNATLELNQLNFDVQINEDGSMNITETWDVYISEVNTLYKTFIKDQTKYSEIKTNRIVIRQAI